MGFSPVTAAAALGLLALAWALVVAATVLLAPVETAINNRFIAEAAGMIEAAGSLKVVGITGSFGKTSTKAILDDLLGEHKNVLATPKSFNTTLGVVRTIREKLTPLHEIFIVEMGARQAGDIREICAIVRPHIGVITSIGEQHLEYFKTVENILRTKCELLDCLRPGGTIVLNGDDPRLAGVEIPPQTKVLRYGLDADGVDLKAGDIAVDASGSRFMVRLPDGRQWEVRSGLLGRHNISNILAGLAVGLALGVDMDRMVRSARRIRPVQHRLELIRSPGGLVIDDSYNSNPAGAASALEVLSSFAGYRKVLVTPGMIELGEREDELNRAFGRQAAAACDYVILVGRDQTRAIAGGLVDAGFPADRVYVARNLQDAVAHLHTVRTAADVVLYENDLPDTHENV
jgi:UDP-N-acetylmuramoyl-tripeptide--D-alanyl-D-alanine ligase